MPTNDIKVFAGAGGANVLTQAEYLALAALSTGFTSGKASSKEVNKALRQATLVAAALAQFVSDQGNVDVLDDGNVAGLAAKLITALNKTSQPLDSTLTSLAGLAAGANQLPYFTGVDAVDLTALTKVGRDLIGKADIGEMVRYLGLSSTVQGDRCFLVGFAAGNANQPYMTHFSSNAVIQLATSDSPALTGTPTAPTAAKTANSTQIATTAFVKSAIATLVDSAPAALDTLKELADALGNDPNFSTTMTNALANKQPKDQVLTDLSGKSVGGILAYLGIKTAAQKDVGTGPNQIPDMGGFTALLGDNGWAKLPSGLIFQWGIAGPLTPQNPDAVANFNITFPNKCLFITEHDQGNAAQKSEIQIGYVTTTGFTAYNLGVLDRTIPSGLQPPITASIPWFAIGY